MDTQLDIRGFGSYANLYKEAIRKEFPDLAEVQLPVGDLNFGNATIELKTPSDFLSSITDGRLRTQPIHMKEHYENSLIVILGSFTDIIAQNILNSIDKDTIHENAVLGTIASIMARHKMPILTLESIKPIDLLTFIPKTDQRYIPYIIKVNKFIKKYDMGHTHYVHTFSLIHSYLDKCNDGKSTEINPIRRKATTKEKQVNMLTAFSGISTEKSKALLTHFGTIQNVINASADSLKTVPGIGPKIANEIVELTNKVYSP
ncbi:MAG: hypothetical protein KAS32_04450 [Candidatus Peribacteraceae bacterium]|nr:hypothetical protein [Candidatus Peribacteraceae bacterium]